MLQGYSNAPSIFKREMDFILGPVSDFANAYFDDIICGTEGKDGESEENLLLRQEADIQKVLEILKAHWLVLDWKKCVLFASKVDFCGHILENGTRRISPGRFLAMEKWPLAAQGCHFFESLFGVFQSF